jgi:uncharacterized membrane protein (DUF106 family)
MDFLTQIIRWLNVPANAAGEFVFAPIATMPGWLSNTIISAIVGPIFLLAFKYTSDQVGYGRAKDSIKANLLALKLYKDSLAVTLQAQGRVFKGAGMLIVYATRPMMVTIVPVLLLLGQMAMWYQFRPLETGEQTMITMKLNVDSSKPMPAVKIIPTEAIEIDSDPVILAANGEILWQARAAKEGTYDLVFQVGDVQVEKQLSIGTGFIPVSPIRPGWDFANVLLYPREKPFRNDAIVKSIEIEYPDRISKTCGTDWWIGYFFVISMAVGFLFKPIFKVKI